MSYLKLRMGLQDSFCRLIVGRTSKNVDGFGESLLVLNGSFGPSPISGHIALVVCLNI